ncbi:PAS domain-containing protein [Pedobacter sp. Leaf194]|uniref:PAS domain-containing sensor histidine kinase n=1 Tax=Pedobacter sp. Leaf194 TaxID=1736297 RepID=UPI0009ECB76B|nr:PAS domain-containing protein [Pedobacter sp. Leaf194]
MSKISIEDRLRLFIRASVDIVYEMSADWSEMKRLDGKDFMSDTAEPTKDWLSKYIPQHEQLRMKTAIAEAINNKTVFDLDHQVNCIDGSVAWTHSRAVPFIDKKGNILHWFGTAGDITKRKADELALRTNLMLLQQAERVAKAGSWSFDAETSTFSWSDGMYSLFQLEKGSVIKPEIYAEFAGADSFEKATSIASLIRLVATPFDEVLNFNINGVNKTMHIKASAVKADGSATMIGVNVDITSLLEAQQAVEELEDGQKSEILKAILNTQEHERYVIAERFHNGIGQLLYAVKLALIQLTQSLAIESTVKFEERKKYLDELLNNAIKDSRALSRELTPQLLQDFGLEVALKDICTRENSAINWSFQIAANATVLDPYLSIFLCRTCQELALNIARESQATHAALSLKENSGLLILSLTHDGTGIIYQNGFSDGIDLSFIKNMVALLNGKFTFNSNVTGSEVSIVLPMSTRFKLMHG